MGNITEHAAPPPAFSGARRTAWPGQQECPIRIWSCVLVMHRFPRDCILGGGGGGGGWGLLVEIANQPHTPTSPKSPPPPKATRAPYILHTNKTFTGEKSLSFPLLAPCFCTVGLLSFPLSSPLSLDLSLHRLRSAYQLLRNQAPRPSSATMCRDARQPLRCFRCLHPQCFEVQHTETLSDSHDFWVQITTCRKPRKK